MYYVPPMAREHGFLRRPETLADLERQADEFVALALQGGRAVKLRVDVPYVAATPAQAQQALDDWLGGVREFCPELCWYFVELLLQRCASMICRYPFIPATGAISVLFRPSTLSL